MKKLLTILFMLVVLLSCKREDNPPEKWILGNWKVIEYNYEDYTQSWTFQFTTDNLIQVKNGVETSHDYFISDDVLYINEKGYHVIFVSLKMILDELNGDEVVRLQKY